MFQLLRVIICIIILHGLVITFSYGYCNYRSSCPDGIEIRYPFWVGDYNNQQGCRYPEFRIDCFGGRAAMNISNHLYHVQNINYRNKIMRVVDVDIEGEGCPRPVRNFSLQSSILHILHNTGVTIFLNCSTHRIENATLLCPDTFANNVAGFSYALPSVEGMIVERSNLSGSCKETVVVPVHDYLGPSDYFGIKAGFDIRWIWTGKNEDSVLSTIMLIIGVIFGAGAVGSCIAVIICKGILYSLYYSIMYHWRNSINNSTNVDAFLKSYGCLSLQRYTYSDIKKMTNSFKEKLGQGGYGSVFKGKLRDGRFVAVKVLNESKGDGEDFINEVATIGRTNHVNVVGLWGFCTEGTKRALVYEFMPNGSLERFIYNKEHLSSTGTSLGWEKVYQISLAISKGLEYLHQGCNTRILHFDIKPHNILLDEDFCPKISDFGLAKICPTRESIVSMLVARGTIGYIAPEVYCRNFGGVSHKSDVYSYGMMVLEMIGGRKNIDATVENISEIYFPQWIYNHITQDINVDGFREIFEMETTRKMIITALWCIQTQPADRPSISKVVEMLEGSIEELQIPPNPFQDPPSRVSP